MCTRRWSGWYCLLGSCQRAAMHGFSTSQAMTESSIDEKVLSCRARKRKLLPGKCADKCTAEALCGALDSDALPLKTLATPMAMRVRRRQRS